MLRITTKNSPQVLTFRLEGRLGGSWVHELEQCWRNTLDSPSRPTICIDLTGVTYIDTAGKVLLTEMHGRGAQFVARDCVTKAVVSEIVGKSATVDSATKGDSA
ncbi:MAG: STAS domain-containing protein [Phycisphaerales bacterium]|nr:STAS domain-containing protein [Phycisphaerales bacterium]